MAYLENVVPCPDCGVRYCLICEVHWADCSCDGPHIDPIVPELCDSSTSAGSRASS